MEVLAVDRRHKKRVVRQGEVYSASEVYESSPRRSTPLSRKSNLSGVAPLAGRGV